MAKMPEAYLEARAQEIREAAMRVFVRRGVGDATIAEVAREAGLSAGALYRYYDSKEALAAAVVQHCGEENRALFEAALAQEGSPFAALTQAGRIVFDAFHAPGARDQFAVNAAALLAASRAEPRQDGPVSELRAFHEGFLAQLAQIIRRGQEAGELDPALDPHGLAVTLVACVEGLRLLFVERHGDVPVEAVYATLVTLLQGGRPAERG